MSSALASYCFVILEKSVAIWYYYEFSLVRKSSMWRRRPRWCTCLSVCKRPHHQWVQSQPKTIISESCFSICLCSSWKLEASDFLLKQKLLQEAVNCSAFFIPFLFHDQREWTLFRLNHWSMVLWNMDWITGALCFLWQVLIFAEKKADVDAIHEYLLLKGVEAVAIHGGKGQ